MTWSSTTMGASSEALKTCPVVFTEESIGSIVRTVMIAPDGTVTVRGCGGGGAAGVAIAGCAGGTAAAESVEVGSPPPPAEAGEAAGFGLAVLRVGVLAAAAGSAGFTSAAGVAAASGAATVAAGGVASAASTVIWSFTLVTPLASLAIL